jgi:hypothetical protein
MPKYSLAQGAEYELKLFIDHLRAAYNPDPNTNPEYRQFLLDEGWTEKEIMEAYPYENTANG